MEAATNAVILLVTIPLAALYVGQGYADRLPNESIAGVILAVSVLAYPLALRLKGRASSRVG